MLKKGSQSKRITLPLKAFLMAWGLVFLCFPPAPAAGEAVDFESIHFDLEKLADGVYAAIHKTGGGAVCNGGLIDLGDKTIVFDPFLSLDAARDLKKAAAKLGASPISYVVDSHAHRDHTNGNMIFKPEAEVIGTEKTRQALLAGAEEYLARVKESSPKQAQSLKIAFDKETDPKKRKDIALWLGYYEALAQDALVLEIIPPDITFTEKITLKGSKRPAELIAPGHGHSETDLVLYLPEDGILFTGDLVFYMMHPYVGDSDPYNWMEILKTIKGWNIKQVVPGHGPVSDAVSLTAMIEYLVMLDKRARNLVNEGIGLDYVDEMPLPVGFEDWDFGDFYPDSVKFMMKYVMQKRLEIK